MKKSFNLAPEDAYCFLLLALLIWWFEENGQRYSGNHNSSLITLHSSLFTHHPSPITHHPHRVGSAGRGMNGERAPGVNRQIAENLARQCRPQSGAVCKVQCISNPNRRM